MPRDTGRSEQEFRAVLETAPVMIWMSGKDGKCTYFNGGWLRYTGRPIASELGEGWAEGVHPDDLARCLEIYVQHFEARKAFRMEYRLRRADGSYGWILDDGAPRYGDDGAFLGFVGSCIDISDQKEAERALRSSSVTKSLARRMLHDLIGRARIPTGTVRDFGRSLSEGSADGKGPEALIEAFQEMGFGSLRLVSHAGARFEFAGMDLLERRAGSNLPTCVLTLGYLEGAVAAITGKRALGNEMSCQSMGHDECRFILMSH